MTLALTIVFSDDIYRGLCEVTGLKSPSIVLGRDHSRSSLLLQGSTLGLCRHGGQRVVGPIGGGGGGGGGPTGTGGDPGGRIGPGSCLQRERRGRRGDDLGDGDLEGSGGGGGGGGGVRSPNPPRIVQELLELQNLADEPILAEAAGKP